MRNSILDGIETEETTQEMREYLHRSVTVEEAEHEEEEEGAYEG